MRMTRLFQENERLRPTKSEKLLQLGCPSESGAKNFTSKRGILSAFCLNSTKNSRVGKILSSRSKH